VRSPLLNVNRACQTCHKVPETELIARAEGIQARTHRMVDTALDALMELVDAIESRRAAGMSADALDGALQAQRRATWLVDFVEAENSSGFHAPQESARTLFEAMDELRKGQMALESAAPAGP
jgi:nitrite reductase (cytochrome c-552)